MVPTCSSHGTGVYGHGRGVVDRSPYVHIHLNTGCLTCVLRNCLTMVVLPLEYGRLGCGAHCLLVARGSSCGGRLETRRLLCTDSVERDVRLIQ